MRISEDARKHVVFFGVAAPPNGDIAYGGTGFLVGLRGTQATPFPLLVTCRHVAKALEAAGGFIVRVNLQAGGSHSIEVEQAEWRYHPDPTVDIAAAPFWLDCQVCDHLFFDIEASIISPDQNQRVKEVQCGDVVSLVGLFRLHHGKERNIAMVHTGHVAALSDPNERIPSLDRQTGKLFSLEGYLVEAQTLEGLSGSPVFIRQVAQVADMPVPGGFVRLRADDGSPLTVYAGVKFLGLYQGAWDGEPGKVLAADRSLEGGLRVPVGMGIVVPGQKIIELLRGDPELKKIHDKFDQETAAGAAKQDSVFTVPPATK